MKNMIQATKLFIILLFSSVAYADVTSNINISNSSNNTVTCLYLQSLSTGTCPGTSVFSNPTNSNFGAMWTGGINLNNQTIAIGANYLYEMIYIAIYQGYQSAGSINPSTTPGSNSYNSNSNIWCIKLGISAGPPVNANSSVINVLLPFADANSISITCDDSTLQCLTSSGTPVTQVF